MALRYRKSFKLFPGVRINLSARGASASFGVPGATINVGRRGARATVGIPGSGMSYSRMISPSHQGSAKPREGWPSEDTPVFDPIAIPAPRPRVAGPSRSKPASRQIASKPLEVLGSPGLAEFSRMLLAARHQASEILHDLNEAIAQRDRLVNELSRRRRSIFRGFYKRRIRAINHEGLATEAEIERLEQWRDESRVPVDFGINEEAQRAWAVLEHTFDELRKSIRVWDVTSDRDVDRARERSTAARSVERTPVEVGFADHDVLAFDGRALRFGNANGHEIILYPSFMLVPRDDGAFALIDMREMTLQFEPVQFQETENLPSDAKVVGHTWLRANKDGTPDRRFGDNQEIPVCLYGKLVWRSGGGLWEEYQCSNAAAAAQFVDAFADLQRMITPGT